MTKLLRTLALQFVWSVGVIYGTVSFPVLEAAAKDFPSDFMRNVKTDYGAKGDGVTDDTAAIQNALNDGRTENKDYHGLPKALYFPAGTYLVSNTLKWNGCCVTLQGQGSGLTVIKLKNNAVGFNDPNVPKAVIETPPGNMSFRQNILDITVNTGINNPGSIGISYNSNNSGSLRDAIVRSGDGKGKVGLDMSRQWPGPCLIRNVSINGFDYGIYIKHAEYGPTFEKITLANQKVAGVRNEGNTLAIRGLQSNNLVPAIQNPLPYGSVIVLDGKLQGGSSAISAIDNGGYLYARNVVASGYQAAIRNQGTLVQGLSQTEYVSDQIYSLFDSPPRSLNLPIKETPIFHDNILTNWGKFTPRWYGDTGELQNLLNSGKSTIYFPQGVYFTYNKKVVTVPATVRRIVGFSSVVNRGPDGGGIVFRVEENSTQPLIIEQFGYGVSVEQASRRTVVMKHGKYNYTGSATAGNLFLEDVELHQPLIFNNSRSIWARQLNNESFIPGVAKITNQGGTLWILGLKTERQGTVINTSARGKTELLGALIYPAVNFTTQDKTEPAFINNESSQSLIYSLSSYLSNGNYDIQVEETRNAVKRQLLTTDMPARAPLFVGYP